jgi:hypothetical protein
MAHRSVRLGLACVTFIAGISARYEGHAAVRNTDPIAVVVQTNAELPAPTVKPIWDVVQPDNIERRLPVRIEHLRLVPTPVVDIVPSSSVAFDMVNTGSTSVTDIMFEISIVAVPARHFERPGTVLAGPYKLRTKVVLQPGYRSSRTSCPLARMACSINRSDSSKNEF